MVQFFASMEQTTLIALLFISWSFYFLLRREPRHYWSSKLDGLIPIIPVFVIPYLALFPFVIASFLLLVYSPFATEFFLSVFIANTAAAFFWFFIPTGMHRPNISGPGFLKRCISWVYRHDGPANVFPSSHVFSAVICGYYLALAYPVHSLLVWAVTVSIALSTVFVKQHYLVDILGGVMCATGAIGMAYLFLSF